MKAMKHAWVLTTINWLVVVSLTSFAFFNAATDHGIQMAVNCFCLGFVFFGMLVNKLMDRRMATVDGLMTDLKSAEAQALAAHAKFEQAIHDGFIEVIPISPDDERGERHPTRH